MTIKELGKIAYDAASYENVVISTGFEIGVDPVDRFIELCKAQKSANKAKGALMAAIDQEEKRAEKEALAAKLIASTPAPVPATD